jgi:multidrug efflux pump subunit AcrA (membrane-fusion protein)
VSPSLAGPIPSLAEADRLLDGLDQLSQSDVTEGEFWQQFLTVVRGMAGGSGVAILFPMGVEWMTVAKCGDVPSNQILSVGELAWRDPSSPTLQGGDEHGRWIASRVETAKAGSGILWIGYRSDDPEPLIDSGRLLLEPFCEILRARQASARSKFGSGWFGRMEESIRCLTQPDSPQDLKQALVDQLVQAMGGIRASFLTGTSDSEDRFRLLCCSGVSGIDRTSPTVKRLEQLAVLASKQGNVLPWSDRTGALALDSQHNGEKSSDTRRDDDGVFKNGIALAWDRGDHGTVHSWLIVEWPDSASMDKALPLLSSWCNSMYHIWLQQERWTRLPKSVQQRLAAAPSDGKSLIRKRFWRFTGLALSVGLLCGLCWPIPMMVESKAILEPISRRLIHASADGYIDELFVEDGDRVVSQQELARLRSPSLELQIEEAVGQLRAIAEKRNGLKVAINQLSPNAPDALANQTRLSTELLMLDSNEAHAREMLEFYQTEKSRLVLRSPIDGIVVARRLRQELENRPIRRGDPLLQVVDLSGAWHLRIQVADRDSDYVGRFYGDSRSGHPREQPADRIVHYTFDSLPSEQFAAQVTQMASVIENRDGTGGYQEVVASVSREDAAKVHMGATARVRFSCGRESFAFVWSRPLIEFLQTRFRLFTRTHKPLSQSPANSS